MAEILYNIHLQREQALFMESAMFLPYPRADKTNTGSEEHLSQVSQPPVKLAKVLGHYTLGSPARLEGEG